MKNSIVIHIKLFESAMKKILQRLSLTKAAYTRNIKIILSKLRATLKEPPHNLTHIFLKH